MADMQQVCVTQITYVFMHYKQAMSGQRKCYNNTNADYELSLDKLKRSNNTIGVNANKIWLLFPTDLHTGQRSV